MASLPRHPCKQRCHNHCCAPLIPLSLHLVLTVSCQLVFSSKRSLSRHSRLLLPPNPLRSRYAPYYYIGVNRRLLLGSPAGREGVVLSHFLLCYVTFLLLPPLFHRCGSIRFFRASFRSAATSFQPKGEFVCAPSFRSVLSVTLQSLHYIHSLRQTLLRTPQKKLHSTQKLRQHSWGSHRTHFAYATFRALCLPPSLHSHRLRLTLRRQVKHSAIAPPLSHRLVAQGCFPCAVFRCICLEL